MQKSLNMLKNLKKLLINWQQAIKLAFIVRWNTWKARKASKRQILVLDVEAFEVIVRTKDEFIVYLQDEIAQLKAINNVPERVRNEVEFKSPRGYKSVHTKIREAIEFSRKKHTPVVVIEEESKYEQEVVE